MGRVRLHSGGISPGEVRLDRRGASERLRPASDDINFRDKGQSAVCGWCGSGRKVDPSLRPRRCAPCRADEQQVAAAAEKLNKAGQPPLGSRVADGASHAKVRRAGEQARARLAERRKVRPAPRKAKAKGAAPAKRPSAAPSGPRRVTEAERRAARGRLVARVARIERELAAPGTAANRRDLLREKLAAAQGLLRDWDDIG